ncbi:hypothetical protein MicloDRAFT_00024500 [Microvirga lotononidis]|uniref:Uncharacterized protein n=1 Tax=Microvirga lotononidis TaxID=864069 RepID=I4YXW4_9HYPH|nr:hypothetical protein MicloDRAFT_00024500 [Microvirga lotononidis]
MGVEQSIAAIIEQILRQEQGPKAPIVNVIQM